MQASWPSRPRSGRLLSCEVARPLGAAASPGAQVRASSGGWRGRGQPPPASVTVQPAEKSYKVSWGGSSSKRPSASSQVRNRESAFSVTSSLVTHHLRSNSNPDEWDQRAIGSYYELFAAALGNLEWLRLCLSQHREEIPADDKGFTAIHFAAQSGKLACLQVLVEEYKFPVDLPTNNGQTPLHLAIHGDNKTMILPCIHYLLKKGAALNTQTCNGSTPLHLAACQGLLKCVKVLVQNGANVHARDAMGCKPIDYCKIWNHRDCARFLKDAMWKRDKKDFACEMGKLKRLKDHLALMEQDYLTKYQKEHQILREADFKKWLHCKQLLRGQSLIRNAKREPCSPRQAMALSKATKYQGLRPPKSFYPSPEARLQQTQRPKLQPLRIRMPIYMQPMVRQSKSWNISNNPARSPTTQISYAQGIRLGVHPDPSSEHDFRSFLKVRSDRHGNAKLCTVAGNQVVPVPQLPFKVIVQELYPSVRPYRMIVPQGFCSISMKNVPQKRHLGNDNFWTDTLAMTLRETFDEAFLAAVQAHQRLPTLPSLKSPP